MKSSISLVVLIILSWAVQVRGQSASDSIRINEIMYAPDSTGVEFVEIINASSIPANLAGWKLSVKSHSLTLPAVELPPSGFLVLTKDTAKLFAKRLTPIHAVELALPMLSNSGSTIVLRMVSGKVIDSISYTPAWGGSLWRSLERRQWDMPNDSANWRSSISPTKSTPGAENSITPPRINIGIRKDTAYFRSDTLHIKLHVQNSGSAASTLSNLTITVDGNAVRNVRLLSIPGLSSIDTEIQIAPSPTKRFTVIAQISEAGDTIHSDDTLSITFPASLKNSAVVLNEIMYAPISPEPEWIELFHSGSESIDLSNCSIRERGTPYTFPSGSMLLSDSFLIVTGYDSLLQLARPERHALSHVIPIQNFPSLNNSGGSLALVDGRGEVVDSIRFGPAFGGSSGHSSERIAWDRPGIDSNNWNSSTDTSKATMGYANTIRLRERDLAIDTVRDSSIGPGLTRLWITVVNRGRQVADVASITVSSITPNSIVPLASLTLTQPLAHSDSAILQTDVQMIRLGYNTIGVAVNFPNDKVATNDTIRRNIIAPIPRRGLLINELMYAPLTTSCQWIELYNNSTYPVETSSIGLSIHSGSNHLNTTLPKDEIPPSGYAIVAADSSLFTAFPGLQMKDTLILRRSSLDLSAQSCTIALSNRDSSMIDTLASNANWTGRSALGGISLERISFSKATLDSSNWQSSVSLQGATPFAKNSVSDQQLATTDIHLEAKPNPFSPDGDGHDDVSSISFALGIDGEASALLRVMDLNGRPVRTLLNGQTFYRAGQASFDGKRDNGTRLPIGIYVLLLETTDQTGTTRSTRTGIVIGKQH